MERNPREEYHNVFCWLLACEQNGLKVVHNEEITRLTGEDERGTRAWYDMNKGYGVVCNP